MENKLEQILNMLIKKGWKPRGEDKIHSCRYYEEEKKFKADYTIAGMPQVLYRSIRELCSIEAGLWQFVCQKKLATARDGDWLRKQHHVRYKYADDTEEDLLHATTDFLNDYRLIESSLKDESELEEFLLNSIKLD